jgi:hypothetical protein
MIVKKAQSILVDKAIAKEFREWFRWKYYWYADLDTINFSGFPPPPDNSGRDVPSTWFTFWDWDGNKKNAPWTWGEGNELNLSEKISGETFYVTHYAEYKKQTSLLEPERPIVQNWSLFVTGGFQEDFDEWFRHFFSHRDVSKATTKCNGKTDQFNCYVSEDGKLDWRWSKDPELTSKGNVITEAQWRERFWYPFKEDSKKTKPVEIMAPERGAQVLFYLNGPEHKFDTSRVYRWDLWTMKFVQYSRIDARPLFEISKHPGYDPDQIALGGAEQQYPLKDVINYCLQSIKKHEDFEWDFEILKALEDALPKQVESNESYKHSVIAEEYAALGIDAEKYLREYAALGLNIEPELRKMFTSVTGVNNIPASPATITPTLGEFKATGASTEERPLSTQGIDAVAEISKILDEEITKSMVKNLQEMYSEMQTESNNDLMLLL